MGAELTALHWLTAMALGDHGFHCHPYFLFAITLQLNTLTMELDDGDFILLGCDMDSSLWPMLSKSYIQYRFALQPSL